mmetsp:Transcript_49622/g.84897  ORF Transcript_49622/g.84897 Transcript_49622/m.84897 type:complete len:218 (-) Transcript_49622:298-951(-)
MRAVGQEEEGTLATAASCTVLGRASTTRPPCSRPCSWQRCFRRWSPSTNPRRQKERERAAEGGSSFEPAKKTAAAAAAVAAVAARKGLSWWRWRCTLRAWRPKSPSSRSCCPSTGSTTSACRPRACLCATRPQCTRTLCSSSAAGPSPRTRQPPKDEGQVVGARWWCGSTAGSGSKSRPRTGPPSSLSASSSTRPCGAKWSSRTWTSQTARAASSAP